MNTGLTLSFIAVFYSLILFVGIWASRKFERGQSTTNILLARRSLPLWVAVITMTATWVGGGYINGTAEIVSQSGSGLLWAQAPWGYAIALLIGGLVFAYPMRKQGYRTMLDPFYERYGQSVGNLLFIPAFLGELFWSSAILTALGTTFATILDLDMTTAILISSAVVILYTMLGGLWSVAYTDVVQLGIIVIGLTLALPFIIETAGGFESVWQAYQTDFAGLATLVPSLDAWSGTSILGESIWLWTDMALLLMLGGIPWQVYFQRVLSAQNERVAVKLSCGAAIGCLLLAIPPILIGVVGGVFDWGILGLSGPEQASQILPYTIKHLAPPLIAAIVLSAVAAAVMSSVDSSVLSVSSMLVCNVLKKESVFVMRVTVLVIGCIATAIALKVQSIYTLWYLCADLVYCVLFPQLVIVLFYRKAIPIAVVAGIAFAVILRVGGGEPLLGIDAFINYPLQGDDGVSSFPFRTLAMLVNLFGTIALSWLITQVQGSEKDNESKLLESQ